MLPRPLPSDVPKTLGLLWRSNHEMETLSRRMLRVLGVTGPQRMVLKIIQSQPESSARAISDAARLHPSTLTGILERLSTRGLLLRHRDATDGRRAHFELTPSGKQVADITQGTVESAMLRSLADLTEDEKEVVLRWLERLGDAFVAARQELPKS